MGGGMVKWWESLAPRCLPTSPPPRTQMHSHSSKSVHWALAMSGYG